LDRHAFFSKRLPHTLSLLSFAQETQSPFASVNDNA
jgi:hypothetical protein